MTTGARFLVLWRAPRDPVAFERHYREVHAPLARRLPGLRRYTFSRNAAALRGELPYYLVAELDWDDMASLRAALRSAEGVATAADGAKLAAYADYDSMIYELDEALEPD